MNKPVICLTGASGFLGRYLAKELAKGYTIRAISYHSLKVPGVSESRIGNILDAGFLKTAVKGCQAVVHAAATTDTTDEQLEEINVQYTEKLAAAARRTSVPKFIYISTENVTQKCLDPYTISKAKAEKIVLDTYKDALILRPSLIFGKTDTRSLHIFGKAVEKLPIVPVFSPVDCTLQPIHAQDVAGITYQGLKLNKKGIYTLVGTEPRTFAEIGKIIALHVGKKRIFLPIPSVFIKLVTAILRFGPRKWKRLHYRLKNALILRNTNKKKLEQAFKYKIPPLETRLKDL